jgi:hypothetical protein
VRALDAPAVATGTDNRRLSAKLELRRWILDEAAFPALRVLDLCAGEGHIWKAIGERYTLESYLPVDRAPRMAGTIRAPSAAKLASGLDPDRFNVIDIDPYGDPWPIWAALEPRLKKKTAIFLTMGTVLMGTLSKPTREQLGIPREWHIPPVRRLAWWAAEYLTRGAFRSFRLSKAGIVRSATVQYCGVLIEKRRPQ